MRSLPVWAFCLAAWPAAQGGYRNYGQFVGLVAGDGPGSGNPMLSALLRQPSPIPLLLCNSRDSFGASVDYHIELARLLEGVGCTHVATVCNSAHKHQKELQEAVPAVEYLDLVVEGAKALNAVAEKHCTGMSQRKVAFLSWDTSGTPDIYRQAMTDNGITGLELITPSSDQQKQVSEAIELSRKLPLETAVAEHIVNKQQVSSKFENIATQLLAAPDMCKIVVAACTDIGPSFNTRSNTLPKDSLIFDTQEGLALSILAHSQKVHTNTVNSNPVGVDIAKLRAAIDQEGYLGVIGGSNREATIATYNGLIALSKPRWFPLLLISDPEIQTSSDEAYTAADEALKKAGATHIIFADSLATVAATDLELASGLEDQVLRANFGHDGN